MPSAACTVKDGAGSPQTTPPYALVTPGATVTIALADTSGASTWSIVCLYTDETSDAASVTASLTVNSGTKTATFTAPAAGKAYIFQSQINGGRDSNGLVLAWTQTFKIATATADGLIVGAANETYEHDAIFGFTGLVNEVIRNGGGGGGGSAGSRIPLDSFDRHCWLLRESALPLIDTGTAALDLSVSGGGTRTHSQTGVVSKCVEFLGGTTSYVRTAVAGTSANPTSNTAITLMAWYRPRTTGAFNRLVAKGFDSTGNTPAAAPESIGILFSNVNTLYVQVNNGGAAKATVGTRAQLALGVWHHVAVSFNAGTVKLWIDGSLVQTDATFPATLNWNGASGGHWYVGGTTVTGGSVQSVDGCLNDVRVCDGIARSDDYIRSVYLAGLGYANGEYPDA